MIPHLNDQELAEALLELALLEAELPDEIDPEEAAELAEAAASEADEHFFDDCED